MKNFHFQNRQPEWIKEAIQPNGIMEHISLLNLKLQTGTPALARLKIGILIKEMLERFTMKINSTLQPDISLWMFAAHDSTIVNVLHTLGLFNAINTIPYYASSLLFELYRVDESMHYVQLYYKKYDDENPEPLHIPRCGRNCPLGRFYELYNDILPKDYKSECQAECNLR